MYKEELIYLHQLMLYLSKFLMNNGAPTSYFDDYTKLNISPHHIHKRKVEHRYAVFVLSKCIANVLSEAQDSTGREVVPKKIADKLGDLAKRCKEEIY